MWEHFSFAVQQPKAENKPGWRTKGRTWMLPSTQHSNGTGINHTRVTLNRAREFLQIPHKRSHYVRQDHPSRGQVPEAPSRILVHCHHHKQKTEFSKRSLCEGRLSSYDHTRWRSELSVEDSVREQRTSLQNGKSHESVTTEHKIPVISFRAS